MRDHNYDLMGKYGKLFQLPFHIWSTELCWKLEVMELNIWHKRLQNKELVHTNMISMDALFCSL